MDPCVESVSCLHTYDENHKLWHYLARAPWPIAKRDFVVNIISKLDKEKGRGIVYSLSTQSPLKPPMKGVVRGETSKI